jgi:flavin-dependent dehydrogenase
MEIDAAIVGAGPAGCAAAIRLAQAGARVVLFTNPVSPAHSPGEVLSSTARVTLSELGLLKSFEALGFPALAASLSLWDEMVPNEREGIVDPYGFGALIDRRHFEEWLIGNASRCGVTLCEGGRDLDVRTDAGAWSIQSPRHAAMFVRSPVLIEATGRSGGLLEQGKRACIDNLVAFLEYGTRQAQMLDQRMLIEASVHGWWYAAPLPDNKAVVAFLTDADLVKKTPSARKAFLDCELAKTLLIRGFADQLEKRDYAHGFPANSSIRAHINGSNWVAIGDAAATYDPLSGQGIATALAKGAAIARLIVNGRSLSDSLAAYADAERLSFTSYLQTQRATYARAAWRFKSRFWSRRTGS